MSQAEQSELITNDDLSTHTKDLLAQLFGNTNIDSVDAVPADGSILDQLTKNVTNINTLQQKEIAILTKINAQVDTLTVAKNDALRQLAEAKRQQEQESGATKKRIGDEKRTLLAQVAFINKTIKSANEKLGNILDEDADTNPMKPLSALSAKLEQAIDKVDVPQVNSAVADAEKALKDAEGKLSKDSVAAGLSGLSARQKTSANSDLEKSTKAVADAKKALDEAKNVVNTGGRKSRKHRKSRKSRKHRKGGKSRKHRKSRKDKKGGWKPSKSHRHRNTKRHRTRKH